MAGLGRRTHYRKHLTDSVMNDLPFPQQDERIAKVVATRGGNQFDILLPLPEDAVLAATAKRKPRLCILPTKFRKLVFIKRGDFVIVETSVGQEQTEAEDQDADKEGGVRCIVKHILYKDQIKHLRAEDFWPSHDPEFNNEIAVDTDAPATPCNEFEATDGRGQIHDGIVYDSMYTDDELDDELMLNTNRLASLVVQDSSDSDGSSD